MFFTCFVVENVIAEPSLDEGRRRREEYQINIRKEKRKDQLAKRRMAPSNRPSATENNNGVNSSSSLANSGKQQPIPSLTVEELRAATEGLYHQDQSVQIESTTKFRKWLSIGKLSLQGLESFLNMHYSVWGALNFSKHRTKTAYSRSDRSRRCTEVRRVLAM